MAHLIGGERVMIARAGGGGSSSSGSSGGGSSFGSSSSSSSTFSGSSSSYSYAVSIDGRILFAGLVLGIIFALIISYVLTEARKKRKALLDAALGAAAAGDPLWREDVLVARTREVFLAFQQAWSDVDGPKMKELLTDSYYRRMVLELNVLINMKRKNVMKNVTIQSVEIQGIFDDVNNAKDEFTATIKASALDVVEQTDTGKIHNEQWASFMEYWIFRRVEGVWKLDLIRQATESAEMREPAIADFSARNGFYYDPDFGWLMLPNQGYLFSDASFGTSDINNHVIGYYREKIIEFYSYVPIIPDEGSPKKNYVIAQAILPITHHDILIRKRKLLLNFVPSGMNEISLEWGDFNKKFFVCADPLDNVTSLELLNPKFMEKIHDLPFELNIEVVGNVLYLYTLDRSASYDQMLEVLSWAFDEMKM